MSDPWYCVSTRLDSWILKLKNYSLHLLTMCVLWKGAHYPSDIMSNRYMYKFRWKNRKTNKWIEGSFFNPYFWYHSILGSYDFKSMKWGNHMEVWSDDLHLQVLLHSQNKMITMKVREITWKTQSIKQVKWTIWKYVN